MHPRYNTIFPQLFNNQKMEVKSEVHLAGKHCDIDLMFLTYPDGAETSIMVANALGFWSAQITSPEDLPNVKFNQ